MDGITEIDPGILEKSTLPEDVADDVKFCFGVIENGGSSALDNGMQNPGPYNNDNINGYLNQLNK